MLFFVVVAWRDEYDLMVVNGGHGVVVVVLIKIIIF